MKKFFGCLILGLLIGSNLGAEPCLVIYRRDLMERWVAYNGSSLCSMDKPSTEDNKYGLKTIEGQLFVSWLNASVNVFDNYISEKSVDDFSTCLYRRELEIPHFVTITPTSNGSLHEKVQYLYNNGSRGYFRTRYFVESGAFVKEGTSLLKIMNWAMYLIEIALIISSFIGSTSRFGNSFRSINLIGLSLLTGLVSFYSAGWFTFWMILVIGFAAFVGYLVVKAKKRYLSVVLGLCMVIYYFFAWIYECKWLCILAFPLIVGEAAAFALMRHHMPSSDRVAQLTQSSIFWIQVFLFWSFVFVITPPEIYLRFFKGPSDYRLGIKGKGFTICVWPMIVLIIVLVLQAIAGFLRITRDRVEYIKRKEQAHSEAYDDHIDGLNSHKDHKKVEEKPLMEF